MKYRQGLEGEGVWEERSMRGREGRTAQREGKGREGSMRGREENGDKMPPNRNIILLTAEFHIKPGSSI